MLIEKIKPMPKYIEKLIKAKDKKLNPKPLGNTRYYAYLTKNDGELVKVTVAVYHSVSSVRLPFQVMSGLFSIIFLA